MKNSPDLVSARREAINSSRSTLFSREWTTLNLVPS